MLNKSSKTWWLKTTTIIYHLSVSVGPPEYSVVMLAQGHSGGWSLVTAQAGDIARFLLSSLWCQRWNDSNSRGAGQLRSSGTSLWVSMSLPGISLQHCVFRVAGPLLCCLRAPEARFPMRAGDQQSCVTFANLAQRWPTITSTIFYSLEASP